VNPWPVAPEVAGSSPVVPANNRRAIKGLAFFSFSFQFEKSPNFSGWTIGLCLLKNQSALGNSPLPPSNDGNLVV
jgi:hypothetical protein